MVIGVLALQGCVEPHIEKLQGLGVGVKRIRKQENLQGLDGLILPGGESTTMAYLVRLFNLEKPLHELAKKIPFWGICAGSILMAKEVSRGWGTHQLSLGLVRANVERNSYGRQLESFRGRIDYSENDVNSNTEVILNVPFIRAPYFLSWDNGVEVQGICDGQPVSLKDGIHSITSFHPELCDSIFFHQKFVDLCTSMSGHGCASEHVY